MNLLRFNFSSTEKTIYFSNIPLEVFFDYNGRKNHFMRFYLLLFVVGYSLSSCAQNGNPDLFNETNYVERKKGADAGYSYVIVFTNKFDSNYTKKEIYWDSTYIKIVSKTFWYKNSPDGPFYTYSDGRLFRKGHFKSGLHDGEVTTYENGKIISKQYFSKGIKTGTWEEFNSKGKLIRRITYDDKGNLVKEEK
jgi:antitoxin component YwqK of YwqJK toxin-antitoxin module